MGDRTTCIVNVSKRDYETLINLPNKDWDKDGFQDYISADEIEDEGDEIKLVQYDANYGMWDTLTDELQAENMEYNHWWGDGGDYKEGTKYHRLVDGCLQELELYCTQETEAELVSKLKKLLDEGKLDELKDEIGKKHQEFFPFEITPLGRQNSVEFIKEIKG